MTRWKIFGYYFCNNCGKWFRTGCYTKDEELDPECKRLYDDVCPKCGALVYEWWQCFPYIFWKIKGESAHVKKLQKRYRRYKKDVK